MDVIEDAYVLCRDGVIEAVGRMRDLAPLEGEVDEIDGRGLCAVPGLVDCHTHACFAGDRVEEFSLSRGGRRLPGASGGRWWHPRDGARDARGRGGSARRETVRHRGWMRAHGTTTFEAKSGYGLDRETELAQLRAFVAAGGVPTWLGAHAVPPSTRTPTRIDFLLAEVLPEAAPLAEAADVFLERGAFDAAQARRYLEACRDAGLALRLHGDQFTEAGAIPLAIELGAGSVDHLEATGDAGVRALAASRVVAVVLPASALFLDRPMAPARALVDAGAALALATDFNPGSAFCESLPVACSLAATQLRLRPRRPRRLHRERRVRARRAGHVGRLAPATTPTSCCSVRPTGATSPPPRRPDRATVVERGEMAYRA